MVGPELEYDPCIVPDMVHAEIHREEPGFIFPEDVPVSGHYWCGGVCGVGHYGRLVAELDDQLVVLDVSFVVSDQTIEEKRLVHNYACRIALDCLVGA